MSNRWQSSDKYTNIIWSQLDLFLEAVKSNMQQISLTSKMLRGVFLNSVLERVNYSVTHPANNPVACHLSRRITNFGWQWAIGSYTLAVFLWIILCIRLLKGANKHNCTPRAVGSCSILREQTVKWDLEISFKKENFETQRILRGFVSYVSQQTLSKNKQKFMIAKCRHHSGLQSLFAYFIWLFNRACHAFMHRL